MDALAVYGSSSSSSSSSDSSSIEEENSSRCERRTSVTAVAHHPNVSNDDTNSNVALLPPPLLLSDPIDDDTTDDDDDDDVPWNKDFLSARQNEAYSRKNKYHVCGSNSHSTPLALRATTTKTCATDRLEPSFDGDTLLLLSECCSAKQSQKFDVCLGSHVPYPPYDKCDETTGSCWCTTNHATEF
jgi:hypothetical protein